MCILTGYYEQKADHRETASKGDSSFWTSSAKNTNANCSRKRNRYLVFDSIRLKYILYSFTVYITIILLYALLNVTSSSSCCYFYHHWRTATCGSFVIRQSEHTIWRRPWPRTLRGKTGSLCLLLIQLELVQLRWNYSSVIERLFCTLCNKIFDTDAWLAVRVESEITDWFKIGKGVRQRQGCLISPLSFNCFSEQVMKESVDEFTWIGVTISGRTINNLRYADNIVLIATLQEALQRLMNKLSTVSHKYGLEINTWRAS